MRARISSLRDFLEINRRDIEGWPSSLKQHPMLCRQCNEPMVVVPNGYSSRWSCQPCDEVNYG